MICPSIINAVAAGGTRKNAVARWRAWSLGICAAAGLLLAALPVHRAVAADWPGNPPPVSSSGNGPMRWDGIYFGGQLGVANADTDFSNTTASFVSFSLRETALQNQVQPSNWAVMPSQIAHGRSYGAFLGYGMQWDQLVLGAEIAYNRASGLDPTAVAAMTRIVTPSVGTDTETVGGTESIKLNDYASFRARAVTPWVNSCLMPSSAARSAASTTRATCF